jgi:hypothetical protein
VRKILLLLLSVSMKRGTGAKVRLRKKIAYGIKNQN